MYCVTNVCAPGADVFGRRKKTKMTKHSENLDWDSLIDEPHMSEDQEQKQLIQWCRTQPRLQFLFHIPNESVGGRGWLIRNRQLGVRSGVPDLMLPVPSNGYHGLFIEMKTMTGQLSEKQKRWLDVLNAFGYLAVVAHGWEEARKIIEDYLDGPETRK